MTKVSIYQTSVSCYNPEATLMDSAKGLIKGHAEILPNTTRRLDHFHLIKDFKDCSRFLKYQEDSAITKAFHMSMFIVKIIKKIKGLYPRYTLLFVERHNHDAYENNYYYILAYGEYTPLVAVARWYRAGEIKNRKQSRSLAAELLKDLASPLAREPNFKLDLPATTRYTAP